MIIKWGSPNHMSAAKNVTAVPSFDTLIFLCEIKLNYKQYTIYLFYIIMNQRQQNMVSISLLIIVCFIYTCSTFNIKNMCQ